MEMLLSICGITKPVLLLQTKQASLFHKMRPVLTKHQGHTSLRAKWLHRYSAFTLFYNGTHSSLSNFLIYSF